MTFPISSSPSSNQSLNPVDSLFGFSNSHCSHTRYRTLVTVCSQMLKMKEAFCSLPFYCIFLNVDLSSFVSFSDRPLLYKNQAKAMNVKFKALCDLTPSSFHAQALLSPLLIPSNCSSLSPPQLSKGPLLSYSSSGQIPSVDRIDLHSFISTSKLSANPAGSAFRIHRGSDCFSSSMPPF